MAFVIPTIHPAYVLRQGRAVSDFIAFDLAKVKRIADRGGPDHTENILYVTPGYPGKLEDVFQSACWWLDTWIKYKPPIAIDVETSSLHYFDCKLYSIAIAEAESRTAVAFGFWDWHTLPPEYEHQLVWRLRQILADVQIAKIYHNAPFDKAVLARRGFQINGETVDTLGLQHIIQPDAPKTLDWAGHTFLDVEPWKLTEQSGKMAFTQDPVKLLLYNGRDALYDALLVEPQMRTIRLRGMNPIIAQWQGRYSDLATDMEITGIPCDLDFRRATAAQIHDQLTRLRYEMRQYLAWPDFNPMSDDQRREALFSKRFKGEPWNLGLKSTQRTKKTKKESTGYKAIIDHLEHPFVKKLTTYVELTHVYATVYRDGTLTDAYGNPEKVSNDCYQSCLSSDGRFHPKWSCVKKTTRFGSNPNFQNMRGKAHPDRKVIRAPDGWKIIASDKDQLELRLLAALCGVPELVKVMQTGGDPHRLSATKIYGERFTEGSSARQKDLRDISKNVTYACVYLAQLLTVWRTVRERKQLDIRTRALMTLPTVEHARNAFLEAFHQIPEWHESNMALVKKRGFLEGEPLGRRRFFPVQPPPLNEVANWPIQMRGAEFVTMAMCYIQDDFRRRFPGEASAIMHCHDEIVALVKDEHVDEACKIINYHFNNQWIDGPLGRVRLTADVNVGQTYYDAKFVKKAA